MDGERVGHTSVSKIKKHSKKFNREYLTFLRGCFNHRIFCSICTRLEKPDIKVLKIFVD